MIEDSALLAKRGELERRLEAGWTYEPPTYFETNHVAGPQRAERIQGLLSCTNGAN